MTSQELQLLLRSRWQELARAGGPMPSFDEVQFRAHSQNGEDGILLFVFALVGTTHRTFVEICAGDGLQCNTANLVLNHGWRGLLFDGDPDKVAKGDAFYRSHPDSNLWPPRFVNAWITRDNINDLVRDNYYTGEVDLLSLDLDGNDYWILDSLSVIQPRVIILEYQTAWGWEESITQRYAPDFAFTDVKVDGPLPRCGASLPAFVNLLRPRGYRLVGAERYCFNAVFVRNDLATDLLPEVEAESCFSHQMARYRVSYTRRNRDAVPDMWQKV